MLTGELFDLLLIVRLEVVNVNDQLATHEVEQHFADALPSFRRGSDERRVKVLPIVLGLAQLVENRVTNFQQTALLKIRRGKAPAPLQIAEETVANHLA